MSYLLFIRPTEADRNYLAARGTCVRRREERNYDPQKANAPLLQI